MKGLITAGGRGTRMRPLTFSTNKHFIPLANKPLLHYAIEEMAGAGIKNIGINYNPGQLEEIESNLGKDNKWGVKFSFILQDRSGGLAHIIQVSQEFLGKGKFVMHLGDNIFHGGIKDLVGGFRKSRASALLTVIEHSENSRLGVPYFSKKGELLKVVEKPKKPPHNLAVPGLYFFDDFIFGAFTGKDKIKPSARGELEITALYNWLLRKKKKVEIGKFKGVWRDPGKFDDWLGTNQFLLDSLVVNGNYSRFSKSVKIEGRVKIGKGCKLKNVLLRGPLVIGDRVVMEDSFIGPYSSVGNGVEIKGAKIQNSVLMEEVKINTPSKPLDSCLVGRRTIIKGNQKACESLELFLGNDCLVNI